MKLLLSILLLLPWVLKGQEVKQSDMEMQRSKKQLETEPVTVKASADTNMAVSLRAAGSSFFLQLQGKGIGAHTINTDDPVIFLLQNDSTVLVNPVAIQGYDDIDLVRTYKHEYIISQDGLESLSRHPVQAVRKHSVIGFEDIFLGEKETEKLKALCASFWQTLDRERLLLPKPKPTSPAFPGGREVWLSFLNKNLQALPPLQPGEQKKAMIQFQVSEDGSISDLQLKQSAGTPYDNELLRILKRMPQWKPSLFQGKEVSSLVTQPVNFYLEEGKVAVRF
ncbi:MAG TPA: TonB family protein [Flavisolibacter sp.]|nr:TonB family protein [Flavisolibacter sp.]